MSLDSPVQPGTLGVHVLSEALGESIVVTLPWGDWFVVDSFMTGKRGTSKNVCGTMAFIERFELPAKKCLFVMLSHLHHDHYSGIPALLTALREEHPDLKLVRHSAYLPKALRADLVRKLEEHEVQWKKNATLHLVGASVKRVLEFCQNQCRSASIGTFPQVGLRDAWGTVPMPAEEIESSFLLNDEFPSLEAATEGIELSAREKSQIVGSQNKIINNMSLALYLASGGNHIFLTGDAEKKSWDALANEKLPPRLSGETSLHEQVTFMKLPHHGSKHAWNPLLKKCLSGTRLTVATNHVHGKNRLPDPELIQKVVKAGVAVGIPDQSLLPENSLKGSAKFEELELQRIKIPLYSIGTHRKAGALAKRTGTKARKPPSVDGELAWFSTVFEAEGRLKALYGGQNATILAG